LAEDWAELLKQARKRLGLSRGEVGERASLSPEAIKAYELGRRHPTEGSLTAVLDALKVDRTEGNRIRASLGYAPDQRVSPEFTEDEIQRGVDGLPWPCFAANETIEVLAANAAAQLLWDVDLSKEYRESIDRNLIGVTTSRRFADRCLNWDEVVTTMIGHWKVHLLGPDDPEEPTPYLERVLENILSGDQTYVRRLLTHWERTPPNWERSPRSRYRVLWHEDEVGDMTFIGMFSPLSLLDNSVIHDWVPADGESWQRLEKLLELRRR
jgi:transcriptional regulator with XRE-family HTH domain